MSVQMCPLPAVSVKGALAAAPPGAAHAKVTRNIQVQLLHHRAERGGAVCGHGGGGVAICWRIWPHQEGAAIYGVLPLLRGRH